MFMTKLIGMLSIFQKFTSMKQKIKRKMTMTNPVSLLVGDKLKDLLNTYEVVGTKYENTHSQYPSHYLTKCVSGPNFGRETWVSNRDLQDYMPKGKYYGKQKDMK